MLVFSNFYAVFDFQNPVSCVSFFIFGIFYLCIYGHDNYQKKEWAMFSGKGLFIVYYNRKDTKMFHG